MVIRLILAVPLAFIGAAWFYYLALPWPLTIRSGPVSTSAVMEQRIEQARARGETLAVRQEWVPLERISPRLRRAVIVAEDGRFTEHDGIDWNALREEFRYGGDAEFSWFSPSDVRALADALNYYRKNRDSIRGRSTITQQLAKNLYFSTDRSVVRKLEEFVVARRLERFLSKDRILELYLNLAEWGPGIFGAEAAARHYFGGTAASLTADQAAALAATLPHPLSSNPKTRPGRMAWRKQLILSRMGGSGPVETVPLGADTPEDPVEPPAAPLGEPAGGAQPADTTAPPDTLARPARPDTLAPPDTGAAGPRN